VPVGACGWRRVTCRAGWDLCRICTRRHPWIAETGLTTLGPSSIEAGLGVVWVSSRGAGGARRATVLCGARGPRTGSLWTPSAPRTTICRRRGGLRADCSGCTRPVSCADGVRCVGARSISARSRRGRARVSSSGTYSAFRSSPHVTVPGSAVTPRSRCRTGLDTPPCQPGPVAATVLGERIPRRSVPAIGTKRVPSVLRLR
jgi:hypothetical protein